MLDTVNNIAKAIFADWSLITLCIVFFVGTLVASFIPWAFAHYRNEYQVCTQRPTAQLSPSHTTVTSHLGAGRWPTHWCCVANHHP